MSNVFRQIRSIFPGAPVHREPGPCVSELFVASRLKRQGTTPPFPRQNDPLPTVDDQFAARCFRLAAERAEHPAPLAPVSPNAGL